MSFISRTVSLLAVASAIGCMGPSAGIGRIPAAEVQQVAPGWNVAQETYLDARFTDEEKGIIARATVQEGSMHDSNAPQAFSQGDVCPPRGPGSHVEAVYEPAGHRHVLVVCAVSAAEFSDADRTRVHDLARVALRHVTRLDLE